jgi:glycosyltransferase involved in cell wall biosynthesis
MSTPAPTPRLALVAHRLGSRSATGVGRYYLELIKGLAEAAGEASLELVAATTREAEAPRWLPPTVERLTIPGPRKLTTLGWAALGRPRVDRALGHPDLVHALHAWAPVPTSAPLVVTVHDLMPVRHPEWYGAVERWSFGRAIAHAAAHAAIVITDSTTEADNLVEQGGFDRDRVRVVPLGVGAEFRDRRPPAVEAAACARHGVEPHRYLVALGAVSSRKNLSVVLRALALLPPEVLPTPSLLVIGPPGADAAKVRAEADALGVAERVVFAGYVPDEDVPVLLGAALMLVHPSVDEGFGLTPLEAMATGTPAVVSSSGSLAEVVGSAAMVIDPHDAEAWADAIQRIAEDPDLEAALVAEGDRHQARFTWTRTAAETRAIYDDVLGSPR